VAPCACALHQEAAPLSCAPRRGPSTTGGFCLLPLMPRWRGGEGCGGRNSGGGDDARGGSDDLGGAATTREAARRRLPLPF